MNVASDQRLEVAAKRERFTAMKPEAVNSI